MNSRRKFIGNTGKILAGTLLTSSLTAEAFAKKSKISPNDKINIALIGCNGMGWANLTSLLKIPEVACVALCDVDDLVLNQRAGELMQQTGKK